MMIADMNRLSREAQDILRDKGIQPMPECKGCGAELTLRMEVVPGTPPALCRLAYNCARCLAMNVVWEAPGSPKQGKVT